MRKGAQVSRNVSERCFGTLKDFRRIATAIMSSGNFLSRSVSLLSSPIGFELIESDLI